MRKTITLMAVSLFTAFISNGQKAISLDSKNIDLDPGNVKQNIAASVTKIKAPATGKNLTWDYTKLKSGSVISTAYFKNKKNKSFSKTAVYDTGYLAPFDSTPGDIYVTNQYFDENSKGLLFAGDYTPLYPKALDDGEPGDHRRGEPVLLLAAVQRHLEKAERQRDECKADVVDADAAGAHGGGVRTQRRGLGHQCAHQAQ